MGACTRAWGGRWGQQGSQGMRARQGKAGVDHCWRHLAGQKVAAAHAGALAGRELQQAACCCHAGVSAGGCACWILCPTRPSTCSAGFFVPLGPPLALASALWAACAATTLLCCAFLTMPLQCLHPPVPSSFLGASLLSLVLSHTQEIMVHFFQCACSVGGPRLCRQPQHHLGSQHAAPLPAV